MNLTKKKIAAIAAIAAMGIGGGAAYAAWSSSGTGSTTGTAGSAASITVTGTSAGPNIRPGHPVDAMFTINNPNDYPVNVTQLSIDNFASSTPGCDAAATFEYNAASTTPSVPTIAANGSANVTWTGAIKLTADPDNDCQGATYSYDVHASADSAA